MDTHGRAAVQGPEGFSSCGSFSLSSSGPSQDGRQQVREILAAQSHLAVLGWVLASRSPAPPALFLEHKAWGEIMALSHLSSLLCHALFILIMQHAVL